MTIISIPLSSFSICSHQGIVDLGGVIRSPPKTYITPALRVVLRSLVIGLTLDVAVIVAIAVSAHRRFKTVNLWLEVYGPMSSNLASVNFSGIVL